jgi:two-component system sensor histidine kinase ChvG
MRRDDDTRRRLAALRRGAPWRGVSLTTRILAVNIVVLALIAFSLLYIDSYRREVLGERFKRASSEAEIAAEALAQANAGARVAVLASIGQRQHLRLRIFDGDGRLVADSFTLAPPSFTLEDPARQPWYLQAARLLDRGMDWLLLAPEVPAYAEPQGISRLENWPEAVQAKVSGGTVVQESYAPDRTPMISAATPLGARGSVLLVQQNARDVTQSVRDARQTLAIIVGVALLLTVYLSLFLARTIVQPLRLLVRAAVRVRLGRDRAVVVPRLPDRGDEIGLLARALSDMSKALRERMDSVEGFAADVAHEIKNPLASLRSALETLDKVEDPALRRQLMDIAGHDVQRIDRLITEIAEASRIDAELARTTFEPVDLTQLARALVDNRQRRGANRDCRLELACEAPAMVAGVAARLERVFDNLLDNAVSFSPPQGVVSISIVASPEAALDVAPETITVEIADNGPGIPVAARERVFQRFHSLRPSAEDFGAHSGLGLAIARTIVEAHDGSLTAQDPLPPMRGARLVMELPAYVWPEEGEE